MTIDRFFKVILAYVGIYLSFKVALWLMPAGPSWPLYTLAGVTIVLLTINMLWGLTQTINGTPSYPSTVRARIRQGFDNGLKDGASKR